KKVNQDEIQKTNIDNEFLVPSTKQTNGLFYIVNSKIGTCSCSIRITSTSCKHQGAALMKFYVSTFNFIPSLTLNDRITYTYIAFGNVANNRSFYTSLRPQSTSQPQECLYAKMGVSNNTQNIEEPSPSEKDKDDDTSFMAFLEE
ncbi:24720_t:CDS:2, partial [Racocetra persica]